MSRSRRPPPPFSTFAVAQADTADKAAVPRRGPARPAAGRTTTSTTTSTARSARRRTAQREEALNQVISGKATVKNRNGSKVVQLKGKKGDSKYVELGREKTDKIFTILVEFGDQIDSTLRRHARARCTTRSPSRTARRTTPRPGRPTTTSSTSRTCTSAPARTSSSVKTYYEKQSSGRYSVDGEVSDWVKVPYNEARYGSNYCGATTAPAPGTWSSDGVTAWVAAAEGRRPDRRRRSRRDLAQYDQWDRYDFDGDGNFNEPDGYIDHFQIVHAGEDESAGGGAQGERRASGRTAGTPTAPTRAPPAPTSNKLGGTQIGDTGIWVGDYTIQPENGGLGVFAHEYGHDLGLPDDYDTTGAARTPPASGR